MCKVINLNEQQESSWNSIYEIDSQYATLQVHLCSKTKELEIVQMNNVDESIRTVLSKNESYDLLKSLASALNVKIVSDT